MKCTYTFKIRGRIKPKKDWIIPLRGRTYDFITDDDGYITHLSVTIPNYSDESLPKVTEQSEGKVKLSINIPSDPNLSIIQDELRVLEGLLSLYGLESIDIKQPEVKWVAESEEEKKKIKLHSIKQSYQSRDEMDVEELPHDLLVGSLIAATEAKELEIPLNFFRKGNLDVFEQRYIEAIYDYYFFLETLYGDGKFKKSSIVNSFLKSDDLIKSIKESVKSTRFVLRERSLLKIFLEQYEDKSEKDIITHIVELRGFLHHHTLKHKDIWHPDKQDRFKVDAFFLQSVCFNVAFKLSAKYVFTEKTKNIFESIGFRTKPKKKKP